ncbi:MAG: Fpg/Nei family DNA glycosylase [Chloroflexi bacterium]|nr:Fpg/Nei family DNA glycosylase [Chloroflexota bacterium]
MPEAPDLFVVRQRLERLLTGAVVRSALVLRPLVLRSLASQDFPTDLTGRSFLAFWCRGKFLGMELSAKGEQRTGSGAAERLLVINPMLSGHLMLCPAADPRLKSVFLVLALEDGREVRYADADQMGKVYYLAPQQLGQVPRLLEQGPDVLDSPLVLEEFAARLRRYAGEVKGVLTRGRVVAGVGNAYADEVLFAAGVYPFTRVHALTRPQLEALHRALYTVPQDAVSVLDGRIGNDIHLKVRDFLQVHGKGGQPCPRCGSRITSITANGYLTNYCRACQPGSLLKR